MKETIVDISSYLRISDAVRGMSNLSLMSTSSEISSSTPWQSLPTPWQNPPIKTFQKVLE
jgi:hypothetical protein